MIQVISHNVVVSTLPNTNDLNCLFDQSGVAISGATNAVNPKQGEAIAVPQFFPLHLPHTINTQRPYTHRHFACL